MTESQPLLLERAVINLTTQSFLVQQLSAGRGADSHLGGGWGQLPKLEAGQESGLGCLAEMPVPKPFPSPKVISRFGLVLEILTVF